MNTRKTKLKKHITKNKKRNKIKTKNKKLLGGTTTIEKPRSLSQLTKAETLTDKMWKSLNITDITSNNDGATVTLNNNPIKAQYYCLLASQYEEKKKYFDLDKNKLSFDYSVINEKDNNEEYFNENDNNDDEVYIRSYNINELTKNRYIYNQEKRLILNNKYYKIQNTCARYDLTRGQTCSYNYVNIDGINYNIYYKACIFLLGKTYYHIEDLHDKCLFFC